MEEKKPHDYWVRGIDSIRFTLALIVFLSHLDNQLAAFLKGLGNSFTFYTGVAYNHIFLGPGAVVAFFIISGFVIHYPLKDKPLNVKEFMVRRWIRIGVPLLIAVVIAVNINGLWLIPIWSLYCELIYYTIYPILRRLSISWKVQLVISFIISIILIFALGKTELNSLLTQSNQGYTGSYAVLGDWITWLIGLPCWLIGVLIAENIEKIKMTISRKSIYLIRVAMLALAAIIVGLKAHYFVSYLFTLNWIAPIIGCWITAEILFFRTHQPLQWLEYAGKFSYSLYLFHIIIIHVSSRFIKMTILTYPLIIFITILTSWIFYLLVEEPSHRLSRYLARKI